MKKGIIRKKKLVTRDKKKVIAWDYFTTEGKRVKDKRTIERCNKLVLPPAWVDVWISPDEDAHLQATGKDVKGRLQYRYHEVWTQARAAEKFDSMAGFARILPMIRRNVNRDLKLDGMPKLKIVALIVKLIDLYHFRVGNDEYARTNESYGLTTLTKGHILIDRSRNAEGRLDAIFEFKGKSGKMWKRRIWEDELALLIERSGALGSRKKSQDLFRYLDEYGRDFDIKAYHINEYLDEITSTHGKVTAKDFRTWAATSKAASRLAKQLDPNTQAARKRVANEVVKTVASDLGNTPTVCRSSYIHPSILKDWADGLFRSKWNKAAKRPGIKGLTKDEVATLNYLS